MSDHKIKNKESLLSHGDAGAKAQVLELTERVLQRLDARKRLHEMTRYCSRCWPWRVGRG